jgi:hypothetical protein
VDQLSTLQESKLVMENPWKIHGKSMDPPIFSDFSVEKHFVSTCFYLLHPFAVGKYGEHHLETGEIRMRRRAAAKPQEFPGTSCFVHGLECG